jgi:hypothetical protein
MRDSFEKNAEIVIAGMNVERRVVLGKERNRFVVEGLLRGVGDSEFCEEVECCLPLMEV